MQVTRRFFNIGTIAIVVPTFASCARKYDSATGVLWDSSELQTQSGSEKLVMRYWADYRALNGGLYEWSVRYRIRAENHSAVLGWHTVPKLFSVSMHGVAHVPSQGTVTINRSPNIDGLKESGDQYVGPSLTTVLPTFTGLTITGVRYGGPSGISRTWP